MKKAIVTGLWSLLLATVLVAGIEIVAERGEHGRRIADALEIDGERLH